LAREQSWRTAWRARSLLSRTKLSGGWNAARADAPLLLDEAGVSTGAQLTPAVDDEQSRGQPVLSQWS
jgi:hypothetical protein